MKEKKLVFICQNNSILREELSNHISRKYYRHLKSIKADILVNGDIKKPHEEIYVGDVIEIKALEEEKQSIWPILDLKLDIRFENDHYLVVNKAKGLLTIPTKAEPVSLYQLLTQYLKTKEVHILNRLDKETRGLVVVAKDRYAAYLLQPTHKHMERRYLCVVHGEVKTSGKIINYIAKNEDNNKRYITNDENLGKIAISNYNILDVKNGKSLLEFILETGRTHQIRLHCSSIGHPIVGDSLYGIDKDEDLLLMSYFVKFIDPFSKEEVSVLLKEEWR